MLGGGSGRGLLFRASIDSHHEQRVVLPTLGAHPEVLVHAEPGDELHVEHVHHVTRALAVCDVDGSVGNGGQVPTRDINLTCPRG